MPPRRSRPAAVASTPTQRPRRSLRMATSDSPDPLAFSPEPAPTSRRRLATSPTAYTSHRSSSAVPPSSTQIPSSETRARPGSKTTTTRLRSGRPSRPIKPILLGDEDLVVPSDEEEYEAWMKEKKRGESSRMAQERYAKRAQKAADQEQSHSVSPRPPVRGKHFVPLFSPESKRLTSPPLSAQTESCSSIATSATVPLSFSGSMDDSTATIVLEDGMQDKEQLASAAAVEAAGVDMPKELQRSGHTGSPERSPRDVELPTARLGTESPSARQHRADHGRVGADLAEMPHADLDRGLTDTPHTPLPERSHDVKDEVFSLSPPRPRTPMGAEGEIAVTKEEQHSLQPVKQSFASPPRSIIADDSALAGTDDQASQLESVKPALPLVFPARSAPADPHTPIKSSQASTSALIFTPSNRISQATPVTPFLESQIGPYNSYPYEHVEPSPSRSLQVEQSPRTLVVDALPVDDDMDISLSAPIASAEHIELAVEVSDPGPHTNSADILVAETVAPVPAPAPTQSADRHLEPHASQTRSITPPLQAPSSPDAFDLLNRRSPSLTPLPETVPPVPPEAIPAPPSAPIVDPALERFRTSRSFRTRTTLQLQPYTRERAIYEAALRKGGLSKNKRAIAPLRDITPPDEGEEDEGDTQPPTGSSLPHEDSQAIVIRPSPPPNPIIEADYEEYFMAHGRRIMNEDELSQETKDQLQDLADKRVAAEKEAKRKARETARLKKRFERFMREQERGDPDDETYRPSPPEPPKTTQANKANKTKKKPTQAAVSRTKPVTYPLRPAATRAEPTSESEASAGVRASNATRPSPAMASFLRSPSPFDDGFMADGGLSPPVIRAASPPVTVPPSDSDLSGSDSDSSSSRPLDKRAKIARRMLPAAMLRRLEQEAARKERDRESARKRTDRHRTPSPARPGRAVVRHGGGDRVEFADFMNEVADGRSSSHSPIATPARHRRDSSHGGETRSDDENRPIYVSSSSSESDSQAEEDHGGYGGGGGGGESLAQLYRGDFESLVAGKGRLPKRKKQHSNAVDRVRGGSKDLHQPNSRKRAKEYRPALGLIKENRGRGVSSLSKGNKAYVQTRLDFEPEDWDRMPSGTSNRKRKSSALLHSSTKQARSRPRPAIRLDDRTIFADDDFAFEEAPTPAPAKRTFSRTKSASVPVPAVEAETLDAGIGKARSWAYLDKLSVDFGISPLPSGLYCADTTIAGSGRLAELIRIAGGQRDVAVLACTAYGVELDPALTQSAVAAVVPIVFDKLYEVTTARVLSQDADEIDLAPLRFFSTFVLGQPDDQSLMDTLRTSSDDLSAKLDLLDLPSGKPGRHARDVMLRLRWAVIELAVSLGSITGDKATVEGSMSSLLSLLLSAGFDKAVRPLKRMLRGESDSPELSDPLLTTWISILRLMHHVSEDGTGLAILTRVLDSQFPRDQVGPLAAERIWYLVFGLCALHQFDDHGRTSADYSPAPHWSLVRRAIGLIKISHNEEAEEGAHVDQLQGRDRYIKIMLARCIRLSSVWQWPFDRESFSIATKDLGVIFKDRQYRNLPTEPAVDFPAFITQFNMSLTAASVGGKRESAFELYLRLVCVAASDLISASQSLTEAQQAERDVQRLVMTIMPVSPVKFNRILPPTPRQLGQLINRYSTMVAATYFSPSLLPWLLACSKKWVTFEMADFDSRQVSIRGLMYVAVACRHHSQSQSQSLHLVVDRLAEILGLLQKELDQSGKESAPVHAPSRLEVERTMVLVVSCVRQVILHGSFDPDQQDTVSYPDPSLLHESWTTRVFALDLSKDLKCSTEVVATIQAFLDTRLKSLPEKAQRAREDNVESQDEFGSLGFELDDTTLAQLGGGGDAIPDPVQKMDEQFANVLESVICPRIYRLLSDMLPPSANDDIATPSEEKISFVAKLTKCFSDCAAILVIDHRRLDWSTFVGPFGKMSWSRLADDRGRLQVGLHFMLNVAQIDPSAFSRHEEDFVSLLLQSLTTSRVDIEYQYFVSVMGVDKVSEYPLLTAVNPALYTDEALFMENRAAILEVILLNLSDQLRSKLDWSVGRRPFLYRCLNLIVSSLAFNDKAIHPARVLHKEEYRAFCHQIIGAMKRTLGDQVVNQGVIPAIKHFM